MNLATARSARLSTEVGLRKVVGAQKSQLIYQFLGEALSISTLSLILALVMIKIAQPALAALFSSQLSFNLLHDRTLAFLAIGIVFGVNLLAGAYPAFVLSSFQPKATLKELTSPGGKGENLRRLLVVSQFIVAIVLLISAGFIGQQMRYIQNKNLGYNKEQILVGTMGGKIRRDFDTFRNMLLENSSVMAVTASEFDINNIQSRSLFRIAEDSRDVQRMATNMRIDYDFIPFYNLELVEGRNFSRELTSEIGESGGYIINETLHNQLGWETAIGKRFGRIDPGSNGPDNLGTVIGVIKDFNFASLHDKIGPMFLYMDKDLLNNIAVRIRPENIQETLAFLKKEWTEFAPGQPFKLRFLDEDFAMQYKNEERIGKNEKDETLSFTRFLCDCFNHRWFS